MRESLQTQNQPQRSPGDTRVMSPPDVAMGYGRGANLQHRSPNFGRHNRDRSRSNSRDRHSTSDSSFSSPSPNKSQYQGRRDEDPLVFLSKTLSSILRHNADKFKMKLMKGGFLYVDEILSKVWKLREFTVEDVFHVVGSNDKQRFTLEQEKENGRWKIRANQGHTIEVEDLDLTPITSADDYPHVIHGTYYEAWEIIKQTGLSRMKRNHIHFAPGEPGAGGVISGMRSSCQVMIYLDLEKALKDGIQFFVSSNNVILTPGDKHGTIPPYYFAGAKDRRQGFKLPFDSGTNTSRPGNNSERKKNQKNKNNEGQGKNFERKESRDDGTKPPPAKRPAVESASKNSSTKAASETKDSHNDAAKKDVRSKDAVASAQGEGVPSNAGPTDAVVREDTGALAKLGRDYQDEEDLKESPDPEMRPTVIPDAEISKCIVSDTMAEKPRFVVVMGCGEDLSKQDSHMKYLLIGTGPHLFIFNMEDRSIMVEGGVKDLLLDTDIIKVFFKIGEVSCSLIQDYDILMNGLPIWDMEILHEKLLKQLSKASQEAITKMEFHKGDYKKWMRQCHNMSLENDDIEKVRLQAVKMFKMFPLFENSMTSTNIKGIKGATFGLALPSNSDHYLAEKINELKLEQKKQKEQEKKASTSNAQEESGKKSGKEGGGGGHGGKKNKKNKKK